MVYNFSLVELCRNIQIRFNEDFNDYFEFQNLSQDKEHFAKLAVDAVMSLKVNVPLVGWSFGFYNSYAFSDNLIPNDRAIQIWRLFKSLKNPVVH